MSEASIFGAINTHLATLASIDEANVAWLGRSYVPQAETPYIGTSMPAYASKALTVGTQGVEETRGVFQVSCNFPLGNGLDDVLAQRDEVRALFPRGLTLQTQDGNWIKFDTPSAKPILEDGAWVRGIVQCPWFLHEVTA